MDASFNLSSHGFPAVLRFIDPCQPSPGHHSSPNRLTSLPRHKRHGKGPTAAAPAPVLHISPTSNITHYSPSFPTMTRHRKNTTRVSNSTTWPKWVFRTGESAILLLPGTCRWGKLEARKGSHGSCMDTASVPIRSLSGLPWVLVVRPSAKLQCHRAISGRLAAIPHAAAQLTHGSTTPRSYPVGIFVCAAQRDAMADTYLSNRTTPSPQSSPPLPPFSVH